MRVQGLYAGDPAAGRSLVESPWLCVEEVPVLCSVGKPESEEAGGHVEESGLGEEAPTAHWVWLSMS